MDTNDNIKESVLKRIHRGDIRMRSRMYFVVRVLGLVLVAALVLVVTLFLLNFILFSIRLNRQDMLLAAGPHGWQAFASFFPWEWLALDVLLVLALQWLLRTFRWGWRTPALYVFGGLALLVLAAGFAVDRGTTLNDDLFRMREQLPSPLKEVYIAARHHDIDDTLVQFGIPLPPDTDDR